MLKVKKLFEKILGNFVQIQKKEYTVTTGESEYSGYYFGDVNLNIPSGFNLLCFGSVRTNNNSFAACQGLGFTSRVWTSWPQTQVTFVAYFIKIGGGTA